MTRRSLLGLAPLQTSVGTRDKTKHMDYISTGKPGEPTRFFMTSGSAPTSTSDNDSTSYDGVLFLDSADNKLKVRLRNGSVITL